jgi:hypothetical protein
MGISQISQWSKADNVVSGSIAIVSHAKDNMQYSKYN